MLWANALQKRLSAPSAYPKHFAVEDSQQRLGGIGGLDQFNFEKRVMGGDGERVKRVVASDAALDTEPIATARSAAQRPTG